MPKPKVIPSAYAGRFIYHFTHIDNLPRILAKGLLCNNHPEFSAGTCRSIAAEGIQARRATMDVQCDPGGKVHDYVPLYFGSLSPMLLAVVNKKNVDQMDILYFEFPITLVARDDVVFTDASANTDIPPNFYSDPSDLDKLNWAEIDSFKWKSADDDLRHQRMAEVLVHSHLAVNEAARVVVWNEPTKQRVEKIVKKLGSPFPPIGFQTQGRYHYFTKFFSEDKDERLQSLVIGPRGIARAYNSACKEIAEKGGGHADAPYANPKKLLEALRKDFGALPQTAELVGLKSANGIHKHTVDIHTLEVVKRLKARAKFKGLPPEDQDSVELAAFLHDIGKGPKARWISSQGIQQVDPNHAVGAMPMMVHILTESVAKVKQTDAELIVKLVCYHDLVGEVLGKGRDEQQIIDVAQSKLELDALFALGKADASSLVEWWWDVESATVLYDRCLKAVKAKHGA